jgi:hypothetical protein
MMQDTLRIMSLTTTYDGYIEPIEEIAAKEGGDGQGMAEAILKYVFGTEPQRPFTTLEEITFGEEEEEEPEARITVSQVAKIQSDEYEVKVYPNPMQAGVNLSNSLPFGSNLRFTLSDILGREIFSKFVIGGEDQFIPLEISNGLYIARVIKDGNTPIFQCKLVKKE